MNAHSTGSRTKRDWLAFDRTDRIGLTILLGAVGAGTLLSTVGASVQRWIAGDPIPLPLSTTITVPELDRAGVHYGTGDYAIDFSDAGIGARVLDLLPGVLTSAVVIGCIILFLRFMVPVGAGQPFAPAQVTRLRAIGFALMLGLPVAALARTAIDGSLIGSMDLGGLEPAFTLSLPWLPMTLGLVAALLAEAFKVGSRLSDDVEGLV
jgi:hypothetical protein